MCIETARADGYGAAVLRDAAFLTKYGNLISKTSAGHGFQPWPSAEVHLRPQELPSGRLIVAVSGHLVAMINGVVHDTHDCTRDGMRCVYGYYKKANTPQTERQTTEKVLDRIRKLLALANSSNIGEATAAAEKAAMLMQEHRIAEARLRIDDDEAIPEEIIESVGEEAAARLMRWRWNLIDACITAQGGHSYSYPIKVDGKWKRELE
jgi:Protein of unknown function (DUF2786)